MFYSNPIFLSVKAELNCKIIGVVSFESDIGASVKILSFYAGYTDGYK